RGGGIDEAVQVALPLNGVEQALGAGDVAALVEVEVGPATGEAGHGREVENDFGAGEGLIERVGAQIKVVEAEVGGVAHGRRVGFFEGAGIVRDEGIEASNAMAVPEEARTESRANEAGGAGDEAFHGCPFP